MKTTRTSRLLLAIPAAALAFTLAACSGGAGGRPTAEELAPVLKSAAATTLGDDAEALEALLPENFYDCLAGKVIESDIPDADLRAIVDGKQPSTDSASTFAEISTQAGAECGVGQ